MFTYVEVHSQPYLKVWQSELEIRTQVLVHVNERARGYSHSWRARLRIVHIEGANGRGQVKKWRLEGQLCPLEDFELHIEMATAQVTH